MAIEIMLFSIPEALVVTWLVKVLAGVKLSRTKIMCIGVLTGICTGLLRVVISSLPLSMISYPLSMVSYAAVIVILFYLFKVSETWKVLVSAGISLPLYLLVEFISIVVIQNVLSPDSWSNLFIKLLAFLPQLLVMVAIVLLFSRANIKLFVEDFYDEGV